MILITLLVYCKHLFDYCKSNRIEMTTCLVEKISSAYPHKNDKFTGHKKKWTHICVYLTLYLMCNEFFKALLDFTWCLWKQLFNLFHLFLFLSSGCVLLVATSLTNRDLLRPLSLQLEHCTALSFFAKNSIVVWSFILFFSDLCLALCLCSLPIKRFLCCLCIFLRSIMYSNLALLARYFYCSSKFLFFLLEFNYFKHIIKFVKLENNEWYFLIQLKNVIKQSNYPFYLCLFFFLPRLLTLRENNSLKY